MCVIECVYRSVCTPILIRSICIDFGIFRFDTDRYQY
ncbi:hypothetical protein M6B38_104965 [Iris pallida]|uniref:Uncharacterized protein n=1 Tax=Iris pallida TaxID=29817 RepID=A0AAX6F3W0_IRIPA|nr:hypothetical protein M6B38_104965 [Iris pallida]